MLYILAIHFCSNCAVDKTYRITVFSCASIPSDLPRLAAICDHVVMGQHHTLLFPCKTNNLRHFININLDFQGKSSKVGHRVIQPLGFCFQGPYTPVVPLEYGSSAMSFLGSIFTSGARGPLYVSRESKEVSPASLPTTNVF